MDQHFRNVISFVGAIVFVFGGLYLVDQYSGWRPFERQVVTTEIKGSVGAVSPIAQGGPAARQASYDFPGPRDETVTAPKPNQLFRCDVDGKAFSSNKPCGYPKVQGRHR